VTTFDGFTQSDFDAFEEQKWASNAFNLERLEVKLKLTALGKALVAELDSELPEQEMGLTEERPSIFNQHKVDCMTLYFLRNEESRHELGMILDKTKSIAEHVNDPALHHRHINLAVSIHSRGVDAGLWLHKNAWVDWNNLVERCREYWERDNLSDILKSLPESIQYCYGESMRPDTQAARDVSTEEVIDGFSKAGFWSIFGEAIPRMDKDLASSELVARLSQLLKILVPLHTFIGWRRDNDFHQLKEVLKEQKEKAQRKFSSVKPGDEVRILKGLATGRVGVIEALERKGVVKVRLGAMLVSLKIDELGKP